MVGTRISKRTVDALICHPNRDRVFLWDDALAGFGIGAFRSGKKVYVIQYRKDGRSHRVSIGDHGRLTPDEARSQAKSLLGSVEKGADPVNERRLAREVRTFREVGDEFLTSHVEPKRKKWTSVEYRRCLERDVYPSIGARRIVDLSRGEIARLHSKLSVEAPTHANRVVAIISAVWNWAARREEVDFGKNPVRGIERNRENRRERFLTREEFSRLGETLHLAETTGLPWTLNTPNSKNLAKEPNRQTLVDPYSIAALRLLIFTGARLREILHARWDQVDTERGAIMLSDSKTGRKPIYLSTAALAIIEAIPRLEDNPYLIPGNKPGSYRADLHRPWTAITRHAKLEGVRIHDLRHSFASVGAGASMGLPIIGKLLGHSQPSTTQLYAHLDMDPLRRAADQIGDAIGAAMQARVNKPPLPDQRD